MMQYVHLYLVAEESKAVARVSKHTSTKLFSQELLTTVRLDQIRPSLIFFPWQTENVVK